ncbi:hypothetical protein BROUX41_000425 [Berkeleyomyces rouxiae]|uniref:uncharacterized protein n=1 Tax=Berkeleyomyces rouxiae TaxID=2035830 RepID=UPI003B7A565D
MKFSVLSMITGAMAVSMSYDNNYADGSRSLDTVACSDGANGLKGKGPAPGYSTLGSLPRFPFVGGVPAINGWNSLACGTCWQVSYNGNSIFVLGVDSGSGGVNTSPTAFQTLVGSLDPGRVEVQVSQVGAASCGM